MCLLKKLVVGDIKDMIWFLNITYMKATHLSSTVGT